MLRLYLRHYPFALIIIVVIALLSLLPIPDMKMGVEVPLADKWTHMVMYGVLTLAREGFCFGLSWHPSRWADCWNLHRHI